jgi:hypothetical protein
MHLHHWYGKIGPQHLLAAQGVGGHISARANILAVEIKQRIRGLQYRRLDRLRARSLKPGT